MTDFGAEIVFVVPGASSDELKRIQALDIDRDWRFFEDGVAAWIVQTYLYLRKNSNFVSIDSEFSRDGINVSHVKHLSGLQRPSGAFVVGVRADYPPVRWCQWHIVQNQSQVAGRALWMPHWPQPGLIPRSGTRGDRVERVAYFGRHVNHYSRLWRRPSGWYKVRDIAERTCSAFGLTLVERGPDSWNDYSDVDVALGLRAFGRARFNTKPPTKLVNAWLAGVPFIGGRDSAFSQIGEPNEEYLIADSPDALHVAVARLVEDKHCYASLRNAGIGIGLEFEASSVTQAWTRQLNLIIKKS